MISTYRSGYARNVHYLEEDVNRCEQGLSCTFTGLPSDIFVLKAMPPFNKI